MANDSDDAAAEAETTLTLVSLADFAAVAFEAPLKGDEVDCDDLRTPFVQALKAAAEGSVEARVFGILAQLVDIRLRVDDKGAPWAPMIMWENGARSAMPDDFRGAQNEILADLASGVKSAPLRARIADIVWWNDRKRQDAALLAIEAYLDCVEPVLNGNARHRFQKDEDAVSIRTPDILNRALHIAARTTKGRAIPARAKQLLLQAIDLAETANAHVVFIRTMTLASHYDALAPADVARRTEAVAGIEGVGNVHVRGPLFQLAAQAWREAGDNDAAERCRIADAELLVSEADRVPAAVAKAHFLAQAIHRYRSLRSQKDRRKELEARLVKAQGDIRDEMGVISMPLDINELTTSAREEFTGITLSTAIRKLAMIAVSRPMVELRAEADRSAQTAPLSTMFSTIHTDSRDGKTVATAPGADIGGAAQSDEWYEHMICRGESMRRQVVMQGQFEPARQIIVDEAPIAERHFMALTSASPFVPPGYEYVFALGFARLFQGDPVSAAHLLIPQMENSLRYLLVHHGGAATMIQSDMIQEDRSLSVMLEKDRATLEAVFGEAAIGELHRLFNSRLGPALRHVWAHGKLSTGHAFAPDVVYACWFVFHFTCLTIGDEHWERQVAPAIDAEI
jgi:hypothetical protein